MAKEITMPSLGMTMDEGRIVNIHVKVGDIVTNGQVVVEIEGEKAAMGIEADADGVVTEIHHGVDETVPVGTVLLVINGAAARVSETAASGQEATLETAKPAESEPAKLYGPQTTLPNLAQTEGWVLATPLARRIAKDAGFKVSTISGSGPKGRILKVDVEAAITPGRAKAAPPATPVGSSVDPILKFFEKGSYELVKHDGMRKTIARRLQEAKRIIPHFYVSVDCELDALLKLREELNAVAPKNEDTPAYKLSVNDVVIKALALALHDVPAANVSWTEEAMIKHKHADVGVAVAIPNGLVTPIIRQAELKSLAVISNEMKDLGKRAKERKLQPREYQGGTTAVSNMGMMGVKDFAAVVNPPHATILAVGASEQRPIVKDGALAIAQMMTVTLSADHRCVNGALGAKLLAAFKGYIENPISMLV